MSSSPIQSADHLEWLQVPRGHLSEFEVNLIEHFLIGSPAIGVTACAGDFIDRFGCTETDAAMALRASLCEGIGIVRLVGTAAELGDALDGDGLLDAPFWEREEFIVAVAQAPKACAKRINTLCPDDTGLAEDRKRIKKSEFERVDTIFRHLRNSLAHGMFREFSIDGRAVYAFQDANEDGNVSARMVLSEATLRRWITEIHRLEKCKA